MPVFELDVELWRNVWKATQRTVAVAPAIREISGNNPGHGDVGVLPDLWETFIRDRNDFPANADEKR